MYRRGPSKSTPANAQCQKCLKRGHYSYECKVSAQERPYVPRPSRTQQLLNPKLAPKLASDATDTIQNTKGLADQELAKREAERARKRELEQDDEDDDGDVSKRARSASYDSVSTISTRGPTSPSRQRVSISPPRPNRAIQSPSPVRGSSRRRSFDSGSDYQRRYSRSPEGGNRGMRSPEPIRRRTRSSSRDESLRRGGQNDPEEPIADRRYGGRRRGRYSQSPSRSPPPENSRRFRSRSPYGHRRPDNSPPRYKDKPTGPYHRNGREQREGAPRREARERSLSPFSKRLALTQAMNAGR
ncbi:zinc knuckle-domain-containing protein [Hypoxylon argillaceum]|nr:zinc knuckle-domain-containing protein [Hypoxylon argillaceum]